MDWGFGSPYAVIAPSRRPVLPPVPAATLAWYKADAIAQSNGSPVASWRNSYGPLGPAVQAVAGSQPTLVTNVLNGLAVVRFDGIDDMVQSAAFLVPQPSNLFVVGRSVTLGTGQFFSDGITGNTRGAFRLASNQISMFAGGFLTDGALDTAFHIFDFSFNGASSVLRVDGGAGTTGDAGSSSSSGITLGAYGGALAFLSGDIEEVILCSDLTLAQHNANGNSLATRSGLIWTPAI